MDGVCDYCGNMLTEWDYMTECGHIICGSMCYNKQEPICPICKKQCKIILIGEKVLKFLKGLHSLNRKERCL